MDSSTKTECEMLEEAVGGAQALANITGKILESIFMSIFKQIFFIIAQPFTFFISLFQDPLRMRGLPETRSQKLPGSDRNSILTLKEYLLLAPFWHQYL